MSSNIFFFVCLSSPMMLWGVRVSMGCMMHYTAHRNGEAQFHQAVVDDRRLERRLTTHSHMWRQNIVVFDGIWIVCVCWFAFVCRHVTCPWFCFGFVQVCCDANDDLNQHAKAPCLILTTSDESSLARLAWGICFRCDYFVHVCHQSSIKKRGECFCCLFSVRCFWCDLCSFV